MNGAGTAFPGSVRQAEAYGTKEQSGKPGSASCRTGLFEQNPRVPAGNGKRRHQRGSGAGHRWRRLAVLAST